MWESLVISLYLKYTAHLIHCLILGEFPLSGLQSEPFDKVARAFPLPTPHPTPRGSLRMSQALTSARGLEQSAAPNLIPPGCEDSRRCSCLVHGMGSLSQLVLPI